MLNTSHITTPRRQTGMVLVMGMVFLLIITLLGLTALTGSTLEEHMAGNTRDINVALQAAEAALRDGEADVAVNVTPESGFDSTCSTGLCALRNDSTPWWNASPGPTWRNYGSSTGSPNLPGLSRQPAYLIEQPFQISGQSLIVGAKPQSAAWAYRITAIGYGNRAETRVVLQSVYIIR